MVEPLSPGPDLSAEWLERWQRTGDRDALDRLLRVEVEALKERVRRRGKNLARGTASASDVAQEAVLGLLRVRTPPRFADPRALRAYLWTAAWRLCLARLGRPGRGAVRLDRTRTQALAGALATSGGLRRGEEEERRVALDLALLRGTRSGCLEWRVSARPSRDPSPCRPSCNRTRASSRSTSSTGRRSAIWWTSAST